MAYTDTFILVADDSTAATGMVPSTMRAKVPKHMYEYELLINNPYKFNQDELGFTVHVHYHAISAAELRANRRALLHDFLSKGQPCLRTSPLTKRFGWGAHHNSSGKIALYSVDSEEYAQFASGANGNVTLINAMRNNRK